jgi:hypothetical protein
MLVEGFGVVFYCLLRLRSLFTCIGFVVGVFGVLGARIE